MQVTESIDSQRLENDLQRLKAIQVTREDVDAVLTDLAKRLGMESLTLDENNAADLVIDDAVDLSLLYLDHFPGLMAAMPLPQENGCMPARLLRLLQANMSWAMTHGGTFAMLPGQKDPVLCRLFVLLDRDAERLEQELARFVELGIAWREALEVDEEPENLPPPTMPPMSGIRA
jgi:hypothetical protein